jgi:zinc transport system permease protein
MNIYVAALLTTALTSLNAGLLSPFLVQKRLSLVSDGLAHVAFAGVALGLLININPYLTAFILAALASHYILTESTSHADAKTATTLTLGIATAILLLSINESLAANVLNYLFGNVYLARTPEILAQTALLLTTTTYIYTYRNQLTLLALDEALAAQRHKHINIHKAILGTLIAATVSLGIRVLGVLLITALLVFPALIALRTAKSQRNTVIQSVALSLTLSTLGVAVSILTDLPASTTIVYAFILGLAGQRAHQALT